jgi:hypothetical protein
MGSCEGCSAGVRAKAGSYDHSIPRDWKGTSDRTKFDLFYLTLGIQRINSAVGNCLNWNYVYLRSYGMQVSPVTRHCACTDASIHLLHPLAHHRCTPQRAVCTGCVQLHAFRHYRFEAAAVHKSALRHCLQGGRR